MKCVRLHSGSVERLRDDLAAALVINGRAEYVAKAVWKKEVRDPQVRALAREQAHEESVERNQVLQSSKKTTPWNAAAKKAKLEKRNASRS